MKLNIWMKFIVVALFLSASIVGFMMKLPVPFRGIDKQMHSAFYFCAAALLNLLFAGRNLLKHVAIFAVLYWFGVAIEYAQEYSNMFFHRRIHGRYGVEDIHFNLKGLTAFSIVWAICSSVWFVWSQWKVQET